MSKREISNYTFWRATVIKQEELEQFLIRGDKRQKSLIINTLSCMKNKEPELFKKCNGKSWLAKFRKAKKNERTT